MIRNKDKAKFIAKQLLETKAVTIRPNEPFKWASGWQSPIYCDNRVLLSYPKIRTIIKESMAQIIKDQFADVQVIAGVATGAIAMGVLVADILDLPFVYVRPKAKEHGRQNQIEGCLQSNQKIVVIEDLISTGMSSNNAVEALKNAQVKVEGMLAIFTYGFEVSQKLFAKQNIKLITLSDYDHLLEQAIDLNAIAEHQLDNLKQWRIDPPHWKPKQ